MALVLNDRVRETTTIVGTGTATLLGTVTGYQAFSVIGNGNTTYYCISDQVGPNWEVGIGTYTSAGTTLARTTVLASSNGGALVSFTAGTKDVFVTYPAETSVSGGGYPNIRPSLNLDFANSQSVDPRITFTRASTATRVRQDGLIEVVASGSPRIDFDPETDVCKGLLIEEQRTNLITYSENFDNAAWQGIATAFPNNIASPDGTITADTLSGAVNADKYRTVNSLTAGVQYTASIFVKAGTVNQLRLRELNSNIHADINLTLNTISVTSGVGTATLVNYGNNWFRATLSYIQVGAIALVSIRNNSAITGDWHVWGAQLEAGSFATSYIPSSDTFTSRASTATYVGSNGLIQSALTNVARYDYNPVNLALAPKLLLESASTNLLTYSEQFDSAAWQGIATAFPNNIASPDGTITADTLSGAVNADKYRTVNSLTAGVQYTASIFVKAGTVNQLRLRELNSNIHADINLTLNTISVTSGVGTATLVNYGNNWFRATLSYIQVGAIALVSIRNNSAITGDWHVWGAQFEVGAFPTSYIPTVASQVTRAADISSSAQTTRVADNAVMTGTNFSSWYNQTEGTVLCKFDTEYTTAPSGIVGGIFVVSDSTPSNMVALQKGSGTSSIAAYIETNASAQLSQALGAITSNTFAIAGVGYKYNDSYSVMNGVGFSDSSTLIPTVSNMRIGESYPTGGWNLNGHISKLSYYPKRLTDSELQALTTG